jgi:hypothetical protein
MTIGYNKGFGFKFADLSPFYTYLPKFVKYSIDWTNEIKQMTAVEI